MSSASMSSPAIWRRAMNWAHTRLSKFQKVLSTSPCPHKSNIQVYRRRLSWPGLSNCKHTNVSQALRASFGAGQDWHCRQWRTITIAAIAALDRKRTQRRGLGRRRLSTGLTDPSTKDARFRLEQRPQAPTVTVLCSESEEALYGSNPGCRDDRPRQQPRQKDWWTEYGAPSGIRRQGEIRRACEV